MKWPQATSNNSGTVLQRRGLEDVVEPSTMLNIDRVHCKRKPQQRTIASGQKAHIPQGRLFLLQTSTPNTRINNRDLTAGWRREHMMASADAGLMERQQLTIVHAATLCTCATSGFTICHGYGRMVTESRSRFIKARISSTRRRPEVYTKLDLDRQVL